MMLHLLSVLLVIGGVVSQTTTTPRPPKTTVVYGDFETELTKRGNYNIILDLIRTAGLVDTLKAAPELTLFAPTDDAFSAISSTDLANIKGDAKRLPDLLSYHVTLESVRTRKRLQDQVLMSYNNKPIRMNVYKLVHVVSAEGVNVTERDIHISNGYVQGLDKVMTPPAGNVVDILTSRPDFSTLTSLVSKAGLVDAIRGDENITVFAPTDDAFSKVSADIMNYLGSQDKQLTETLLFHIVKRLTLYSIGMRHSMTFPSADGHHDRLMLLEDDNGDASINGAKIIEKDISATNGVIHVIDDVLVPIKVLIAMEDTGINVG